MSQLDLFGGVRDGTGYVSVQDEARAMMERRPATDNSSAVYPGYRLVTFSAEPGCSTCANAVWKSEWCKTRHRKVDIDYGTCERYEWDMVSEEDDE